jgi:hypothetical protein
MTKLPNLLKNCHFKKKSLDKALKLNKKQGRESRDMDGRLAYKVDILEV